MTWAADGDLSLAQMPMVRELTLEEAAMILSSLAAGGDLEAGKVLEMMLLANPVAVC